MWRMVDRDRALMAIALRLDAAACCFLCTDRVRGRRDCGHYAQYAEYGPHVPFLLDVIVQRYVGRVACALN
jgi:hypothetical protein